MMRWLIDTNVPLRALHRPDPFHEAAWGAVRQLRRRGEVLCYTLQTLAEFWTVCTRPAASRGGLGLTVVEADLRVRVIERHLTFLPDTLKCVHTGGALSSSTGSRGFEPTTLAWSHQCLPMISRTSSHLTWTTFVLLGR